MGIKFGCDYKSEAPDLLRTARDLDLNVFGVSFHVGSIEFSGSVQCARCAGNGQLLPTADYALFH